MASPHAKSLVGVIAAAMISACGLLPKPTIQWQASLNASLDHQTPLTLFTLSPSTASQSVLTVSAHETPVGRTTTDAAAGPRTIGAVWAPAALAPYLELAMAEPAPTQGPMFAHLSPGRGWVLVGDFAGEGGGSVETTIPLTADLRPQFAQECVLTLAWRDPSGSWWRQRFGVGGRALGPARMTPTPDQ